MLGALYSWKKKEKKKKKKITPNRGEGGGGPVRPIPWSKGPVALTRPDHEGKGNNFFYKRRGESHNRGGEYNKNMFSAERRTIFPSKGGGEGGITAH